MNKIRIFFSNLWLVRKMILINLLAVTVVTFLIVALLMWGFRFYTLHGESVEVPDLVNMKIEDAEKLLATRNLGILVADSVCRGNSKGGLIKEQTPRAKFRVKESRKIYIIVTKHAECTVNLYYNQLIGHSRDYVVRQLKRSNLKVGSLTYRPGGKAPNTVVEASINGVPIFVEANPDAGERPPEKPRAIPQNAVIDLVLLEGIDALPQMVPDVVCGTYSSAEFAIKGNEFNIGTIHTTGTIIDTAAAWVYKQSPAPSSYTTMGSGISLWLMSAYPEGCKDNDDLFPND